jgi:PIN domain nuclease of toxin-antitoxin system
MIASSPGSRLLLDTHVFIWWREESPRLDARIVEEIAVAQEVFVSLATAWEIAIKVSSGRLNVPSAVGPAVLDSGFTPLPITFEHTERVATLPRHHADPFDRMLAAQALHEGLTLVTHDRAFAPYALPVRWA